MKLAVDRLVVTYILLDNYGEEETDLQSKTLILPVSLYYLTLPTLTYGHKLKVVTERMRL